MYNVYTVEVDYGAHTHIMEVKVPDGAITEDFIRRFAEHTIPGLHTVEDHVEYICRTVVQNPAIAYLNGYGSIGKDMDDEDYHYLLHVWDEERKVAHKIRLGYRFRNPREDTKARVTAWEEVSE